jgi:predicted dehydrogenase
VGCGGISRTWLIALHEIPEVQIVGLVDIDKKAALRLADEAGLRGVPVGTELDVMLRQVSPEVVFNCTVPEAHLEVTLCALQYGCHVLGEKPLADSMEAARRMVAAAKEAKRIFAVVQNRRYDPAIRRLRYFLDTGALGRITTVHSDFFMGVHFGGFRDHAQHELLLDMAIHTFDAARFITAAEPVSVYCYEWNPPGSWYDHGASAVAIFEMERDLVYTYRGSFCAEGLNTSWECDWRIIGEKGSLRWDGASHFEVEVVVGRNGAFSQLQPVEVPSHDAGQKVGGHGGVIREFIRCVRSGGTPETVCTDNIRSLAMVFGAIESASAGHRVNVSV